jgi:hypothetical protein
VTVTDDERQTLHDLIKKGTVSARRLTRAHMLESMHNKQPRLVWPFASVRSAD